MKKAFTLTILTFILLAGCSTDSSTSEEESKVINNFPTTAGTESAKESDICTDPETGEEMTLEEARVVSGRTSLCRDQLKEFAFCNETTGTWWIDRENDKEGCNPACVVNIKSKNVEVNWRCTGLIPE